MSVQLKRRIREYLEKNNEKEYIDIDDMTKNLYRVFPEYKRQKFAVFKKKVNSTFQQIKEIDAEDESCTNVRVKEEDSVNGKSVNDSINDLYNNKSKNCSKDDEVSDKGQGQEELIIDLESPKKSTSNGKLKRKISENAESENPTPKRSKINNNNNKVGQITKPELTFSSMGGCEKAIDELFRCSRHLIYPQYYQQLGVTPPRGCVLHGPPGCGKTSLAKALAGSLKVNLVSVSGTELISGISGDSESKIRDLFLVAKSSTPCVLLIDGLEVVAKRRETSTRDMDIRILSQLIKSVDDLEKEDKVFIVGATDKLESIDPGLTIGDRLEESISIGIPDIKSRRKILEVILEGCSIEKERVNLDELAKLTPGFVGSDLRALIRKAAGNAENRIYTGGEKVQMTKEDFESALKAVKPSALKEGFATVPDVKFEDIGALDHIIKELEMAVCGPVQHPEMIEELGLDSPSGVLLCGPPGCGKTLLAKAVANQAGVNFISVKGPEMINMYLGESERAVRQVFQRARNSAPCVIFFDEIDSICPRRTGSDHNANNRLVNQLLTEMDGVEGRQGVYVMGATNRVDMIDEAILRPGRLTNIFFVDLPDERGRIEILKKLTKKKPKLDDDVNLAQLAGMTECEGMSGADLAQLVRRAAQIRMEELIQGKSGGPLTVRLNHFKTALRYVKASVDAKKYEKMKQKYKSNEHLVLVTPKIEAQEQESEPRYLPQMMVNIKSSGKEGIVQQASGSQCLVMTEDNQRMQISIADLEPFLPEEGEWVKLLKANSRRDSAKVIQFNGDLLQLEFANGEKMNSVNMDSLCKVKE